MIRYIDIDSPTGSPSSSSGVISPSSLTNILFSSTTFELYLSPLEEDFQRYNRPLRFPHLSERIPRSPFSNIAEYNRSIANELRRIFESEVPCLAFDEIEFTTNTSAFPEEFIAHRISFIPIPSESFGSSTSERVATLSARGPCNVDSTLMRLDGNPFIEEEILICPLRPGEELELTAGIRLGTASEHVKWSPVAGVSFKEITPNLFRFTLEETGALPVPEIIKRAAITLEERCGVVLYGF